MARRRPSRPDTFRSCGALASKLTYLFHPVPDFLERRAITETRYGASGRDSRTEKIIASPRYG
jgi:hypothetical protein